MSEPSQRSANTEAIGSSPRSRVFRFAMFAVIALPALLQIALEAREGTRPTVLSLFSALPSERSLREFEVRVEGSSRVGRVAARWAPRVADLLDRNTDQVVRGRGEWLYLRDGLRYVAAPAFDSPTARRRLAIGEAFGEPESVILDFHRQLETLGIGLVVVTVPSKAGVRTDPLIGGEASETALDNPGWAATAERLGSQGVVLVDAADGLMAVRSRGEEAFLVTDTHWSPVGMAAVAGDVAKVVEERGLLDPGRRRVFDHRRVTFEGRGDLEILLAAGDPSRVVDREVTLQQVIATEEGRPPDHRPARVLLLGDSMTGVFSDLRLGQGTRGGFAEQLADALGEFVETIVVPAGGATRVRQALAIEPQRLAGKDLVVWQFSRRDLMFAEGGWQKVVLPERVDPGLEHDEPSGPVFTRARLEEKTSLPVPLDYGDCFVIYRYRPLESDLPGGVDLPGAEDGFFVAHWGVQDWQPSEPVRYREGSEMALELVPFEDRHSLADTCWYDTVGLDGPLWWADSVEPR